MAFANFLTGITNGLLGENYGNGQVNQTAKFIGDAVKSVPGVASSINSASKSGYTAGTIAANAVRNGSITAAQALQNAVSGAAKVTGDTLYYAGVDPVGFFDSGVHFDTKNDGTVVTTPNPQPTNPTTPVPSDGGTSVPIPDNPYYMADIAAIYGMDASTAYQEALSNTSYQRAVIDLQRAGLNPILATGQGASTGVYGAQLAGDGKVSNGVSTAKSAHKWYNILSNVGTVVGAITGHPAAGRAAGGLLGNFVDGYYD